MVSQLGIIAAILLGLCAFILFILYKRQSLRLEKHQMLSKTADERLKMSIMHLKNSVFHNILEADITENTLIGENAKKLALLLNLESNATYSELVEALMKERVHPDYAEEYRKILSRNHILSVHKKGLASFKYECLERLDTINYCWAKLHVCLYESDVTGTLRVIVYVSNIDREKKKELALLEKSETDPLTGLHNKVSTYNRICQLLSEDKTKYSAMLVVDLDNFKTLNDSYGHLTGDRILTDVSGSLREIFRKSDIVGRIGGDEFLILLYDVNSLVTVLKKAEEVCKLLASLRWDQCPGLEISCSMGISLSSPGISYEKMFSRADQALYQAKREGRNKYVLWQDEEK